MKSLLRFCALLLLASFPAAWAQVSSSTISFIQIHHVGPPAASDEFIRANIRVKVGDPYQLLAVDDDVQNLYATGQFYTIRVTEGRTNGGVSLTYFLQGKPRLVDIKFEGNVKYSNAKLQKKLTSKVGEPLDEQKLFTDVQEIQKLYQKGGYPGTRVEYSLGIEQEAGRGVATIKITESPKIKIKRVEFVGATAFTHKELQKAIITHKHWMLAWMTKKKGVFKDEEFEDDKGRLAEFYHSKGYIDFELKGEPEFEYPTPRTMVVRFNISEGRQYKVGSVKFTGNELFSTAEIKQGLDDLQPHGVLIKKEKLGPNGLKMDVGDVYTPKGFQDDSQQISDFYGSRGYLETARSLQVIRIPNTDTGTMDLEFKIAEGEQSKIEKIEIRGNTKTKDRVIRRELSVHPGDVFDMVRVDLSRRRIQYLDYFEKVDPRPEPTTVASRKNLVIGVDEKNTGRFMVGAGLSSESGLVGFAELIQGNFDLFHPPTFTGGGQKFRLRMQLGTEQQDYEVSFIEPWFLGKKLVLEVDLYHRERNFLSPENLYDERRTGGFLGITRALGSEFLIGTVGYKLEEVGIDFHGQVGSSNGIPFATPPIPNTLLMEQGSSLISKLDFSIAVDNRNSPKLPDKGQRTELSAELAGPFGGEKDYYKLQLRSHWYFKGFFEGHVLEVLGGIGVSDAYGRSDSVPFYDRSYLGGINTLRGFEYRSISPREPGSGSNEPIGGNTYWIGSIEYSLPIMPRLRFAVFYDVGNVILDPYSFDMANFNDNWGLGIRLDLPIGPLRMDYGIPIHHDQFNGSSGQFQFSVGFERPF